MKSLVKIDKFLGKAMPYLTPLGVILAVLAPFLFLWLTTPVNIVSADSDLGFFNQQIQVYVFILLTLPGALSLKFKDLVAPFKKPLLLLSYLLMASVLMPAISFFTMRLLFPTDMDTVIGFLLLTAIPSAVSSFIWVTIFDGSKEFILGIILITNLLAVIVVPTTLQIFIGEEVPFDFMKAIWQLCIMLLIPTIVGILLNQLSDGKIPKAILPIFSPLSKFTLILIVGASAASAQSKGQLLWSEPSFYLKLAFSFVLCVIIYSLAWLLGGLFKQPLDVKTALFFGHGCKNLGSGLMLAAQLFPGSPAALVPLVVATLFQQPLGAIIIKIISRKGVKNG